MWRLGKGWESGRQASGYDKLLLLEGPCFDSYLLRFGVGASVPLHRDPLDGARHYRLNLIVVPARRGGEFECADALIDRPRIKLFRPDLCPHAVHEVKAGTRWVLSLGLALAPRPRLSSGRAQGSPVARSVGTWAGGRRRGCGDRSLIRG